MADRVWFIRDGCGMVCAVMTWLLVVYADFVVTFVMLLLGFWYLGVDYALLTAVLVAIVDALPVLGTGTVLVPWSVYHLLLGSVPRGVALLAL